MKTLELFMGVSFLSSSFLVHRNKYNTLPPIWDQKLIRIDKNEIYINKLESKYNTNI